MSNEEILKFVATFNYAVLYVRSDKFGPGEHRWKSSIESLRDDVKMTLVERIEKYHQRYSQSLA